MKLKNKTYDKWKFILLTLEPALVGLISGVGVLFKLDTTIIVGLIGLISTFLGSILQVSSSNYNDNIVSNINVEEETL